MATAKTYRELLDAVLYSRSVFLVPKEGDLPKVEFVLKMDLCAFSADVFVGKARLQSYPACWHNATLTGDFFNRTLVLSWDDAQLPSLIVTACLAEGKRQRAWPFQD